MTVTKLPTAPTSFYTTRKAGKGWAVLMVTPVGTKSIRSTLARYADRESAVAHAKVIADMMQRPFVEGGKA